MGKITVERVENNRMNIMPRSGIFKPIPTENLIKMLYYNEFTHENVFWFLEKIATDPFETAKWMRKELKSKYDKDRELMSLFKYIDNNKITDIEEMGEKRIMSSIRSLDKNKISDEDMLYMFGLLVKNPYRFMRSFEYAYREIDSKHGFKKDLSPAVKTIINSLNTGDFLEGGKYYEKYTMEIPGDINEKNDMELATYLAAEIDASKVRTYSTPATEYWGMEKLQALVQGTLVEGEEQKFLVVSVDYSAYEEDIGKVIGVYESDEKTSNKKFVEKVMGPKATPFSFEKSYKGKEQPGYAHPEDTYTDEDLNLLKITGNEPGYEHPEGTYTDEDLGIIRSDPDFKNPENTRGTKFL